MITVIATKAQRQRNDFLLELASALNGCGHSHHNMPPSIPGQQQTITQHPVAHVWYATTADGFQLKFTHMHVLTVGRVGVRISRAIIQSCNDCGTPVADPDFPSGDEHGRLYKVWGTDRCEMSST